MIQLDVPDEGSPRHRYEIKNRGHLDSIREGPYITHNVLITHANFLKTTNEDNKLTVYRIFPSGGGYNYIGDIIALVTWYFIVVYVIAVIPIACYCETKLVNIINTIVLCIIMMYHIIAVYGVTKNRKKFRRASYVIEVSANKYMGLQNYFIDVTASNVSEHNFINSTQRQKILLTLSKTHCKSYYSKYTRLVLESSTVPLVLGFDG